MEDVHIKRSSNYKETAIIMQWRLYDVSAIHPINARASERAAGIPHEIRIIRFALDIPEFFKLCRHSVHTDHLSAVSTASLHASEVLTRHNSPFQSHPRVWDHSHTP